MKVLLLIHSLQGGGAERITANLANAWLAMGWMVTVVTMATRSVDQYVLDAGVKRVSLDLASNSRSRLEALTNNFHRLVALRGVLVQEQPDIAVAMMHTACIQLALASAGLPIICIGAERDQPAQSNVHGIWALLRRLVYGRLDAVAAQTTEAARWLLEHTGARHVTVIPNQVIWPLPNLEPTLVPSSVGKGARHRILAVGRLEEVKGHDFLLDAFSHLTSRHPDWELVIVGEGSQRAALQDRIQTLGLSGKAFLAGRAGNLSDWYCKADLFVMSSRYEGFPNALVEAMAHGVPAVSVDCESGPRNILRRDIDGLLTPPGDLDAFSIALDRMMGDGDLRRRFGKRAVDVRERLSEANIQALWQKLFREVADARRR